MIVDLQYSTLIKVCTMVVLIHLRRYSQPVHDEAFVGSHEGKHPLYHSLSFQRIKWKKGNNS